MEIYDLHKPDFESVLQALALSETAYDARVARLLLDLIDGLRREPVGPRVLASFYFEHELWLIYYAPRKSSCKITVKMDHQDYGPLVDGLPLFHYRMASQITDATKDRNLPIVEERLRSVDSAVEFVRNVIRETRLLP